MKSNKLYAIKRINFGGKIKVELKFVAPIQGEHELTLYCICDSYVGCDQVIFLHNFDISVFMKIRGRK